MSWMGGPKYAKIFTSAICDFLFEVVAKCLRFQKMVYHEKSVQGSWEVKDVDFKNDM